VTARDEGGFEMSNILNTPSHPDGAHCPGCGAPLERVHRHALDRFVSMFRSVHRYRCIDPKCNWEGVVGREDVTASLQATLNWRSRLLWMMGGVVLATSGMLAARMVGGTRVASRPAAPAPASAASVPREAGDWDMLGSPPGLHHDGVELNSDDTRVAKNSTPLHLRRNCVWGVPGRTPYRGTVEQALMAAQLPPEVVMRIAELAKNGFTQDRVEISRTAIRSVDGRRIFKPQIPAMGFGDTLCFETQVNFPAGHVEYAALYEADDRSGRRYSVMVPFVCNNVSVLGVRREAGLPGPTPVPEPASWILTLTALGLLAGLRLRPTKGRS
jgi:hypothetical protein